MVWSKIVLHSVVQIYELHVHSTKLSNLPLTDIIRDRFCLYKVLKVQRTTQKLSSLRLRLQVLRVKGCRRATVLYSGKSTILCYSRADPPLALISSKRSTLTKKPRQECYSPPRTQGRQRSHYKRKVTAIKKCLNSFLQSKSINSHLRINCVCIYDILLVTNFQTRSAPKYK